MPEFNTSFKPAGIMPRLAKPYELASQEVAPIINQTININEPVKTPWETGRALRKEAIKFGLAGCLLYTSTLITRLGRVRFIA